MKRYTTRVAVPAECAERIAALRCPFPPLAQALIELSPAGSEERSLLESISNHVNARGGPRGWSSRRCSTTSSHRGMIECG